MRLLPLLFLMGCDYFLPTQESTPVCIVETGYVRYSLYEPPRPIVMCTCESGAPIPPECGGGIAP